MGLALQLAEVNVFDGASGPRECGAATVIARAADRNHIKGPKIVPVVVSVCRLAAIHAFLLLMGRESAAQKRRSPCRLCLSNDSLPSGPPAVPANVAGMVNPLSPSARGAWPDCVSHHHRHRRPTFLRACALRSSQRSIWSRRRGGSFERHCETAPGVTLNSSAIAFALPSKCRLMMWSISKVAPWYSGLNKSASG